MKVFDLAEQQDIHREENRSQFWLAFSSFISHTEEQKNQDSDIFKLKNDLINCNSFPLLTVKQEKYEKTERMV